MRTNLKVGVTKGEVVKLVGQCIHDRYQFCSLFICLRVEEEWWREELFLPDHCVKQLESGGQDISLQLQFLGQSEM